MKIQRVIETQDITEYRKALEGLEEITDLEKAEIDFRLMGQIVHDQAFRLSRKVNTELLEPISRWLSDEDWMIRFEVYNQDVPNWAEYKRKQREWNEHQKQLSAERMRAYWQEIHRMRTLRQKVAGLIPRTTMAKTENHALTADSTHLRAILEPFSPSGEKKAETHGKFIRAKSLSAADILPWKLIIAADLKRLESQSLTSSLSSLPIYFPENQKMDITAKLIHLLFMESEGTVTLRQSKPFGEITIEQNAVDKSNLQNDQPGGSFVITDQSATEYQFNWHNLSDAQRRRVIADLKDNKILCRT